MNIAITIQMPEQIAANLAASGEDLPRRVLEAVAIEGYRSEKLSVGQVAEILGMGVLEAEQFLFEQKVELLYSIDDFERDRESLRQVLSK